MPHWRILSKLTWVFNMTITIITFVLWRRYCSRYLSNHNFELKLTL